MPAAPSPLRLLVVTTDLRSPPRQGSDVVALRALAELSARCELHLVALSDAAAPQLPPGLFKSVEVVTRRAFSPLERRLRAARGLAEGKPIMVALGEHPAMNEAVDVALRRRPYDAVLLFELSALQYCPPRVHPRVVANIEDPPSLKLQRKLELPVYRPWERARMKLNAALTRRYERRALPGLGVVSVLSEEDAEAMRREGHGNVAWLPYGVTAAPWAEVPRSAARRPGSIVISGNLFHLPNVDGVLSFLEQTFPLVLREAPAARLVLVGREPDSRIARAAARFGERVELKGAVPELAPFLKQAQVSVCPVRLRIGVQTKVLEAMAWGTPVVSTVEGNSGVRGQPGVHLHVEPTPAAQARRIVELLAGEGWEALSRAGHDFVAEHFSWRRSAAALEAHVRGLEQRT